MIAGPFGVPWMVHVVLTATRSIRGPAIRLFRQRRRRLGSPVAGCRAGRQRVPRTMTDSTTLRSRRMTMAEKSEALAKRIETKAQEALTVLEKVTEADWRKVTEAETWTVGATVRHLVVAFQNVPGIVMGIVDGQTRGGLTRAMLDEMNARNAQEHAACPRAETIDLLHRSTAKAAGMVRGLSDQQLGRSGTVFSDAPPMTPEQLIQAALIDHIDEHIGNIRKTLGR